MARLPCTHFGSMRLSQGLLIGKGHTTTRQPPACLTRRLCALSHARTAWLTCHEALSHTSSSAVFPAAAELCRQPRQKLHRHGTDRTTVHKAKEHALCVHAEQPITCHRLGCRVVTGLARFGSSAAACRLSRSGDWAGRSGSTTPHPESPTPSRDAPTLAQSSDRATFFSRILRIRARDPVFRALPIRPQSLQGPADAFITQQALSHAVFIAHLRCEGQRPHPRLCLAIGPWRLMQEVAGGVHSWGHPGAASWSSDDSIAAPSPPHPACQRHG